MIKRKEISDPTSCLNKAADDEPVFVLLGRDACAPGIIHRWAEMRVAIGKNTWDDQQIVEAITLANRMVDWFAKQEPKS